MTCRRLPPPEQLVPRKSSLATNRIFPVITRKKAVAQTIDDIPVSLASRAGDQKTARRELRDLLRKRFHFNNLKPELMDMNVLREDVGRSYAFNYQVNRSFLPQIIKLAKESDLKLILVHVKKRPDEDGITRRPQPVVEYIEQLKAYLKEQGVDFYDFTDDPEVTLSLYANGDHIADKYKPRYTEIFYKRLAHVFK